MKRAFALITLVAISATPAFSVVFDTASGTNWFDGSNYAPVGVPGATTNVEIFSTAAVAAEIQSTGALAKKVKLGRSNWPGSLVVGASGTLATTSNLTLQLAANGNQTSSLTNHGVINLGGILKSSGINTIENHGTLTATGMVLGGHANAESSFTNTGTIDLGSGGWLHLCSNSTAGTEFTMLDGSVTAKKLNLHDGRKVNLKLYGGTIRVNDMTSASADFLIDVKGDGELILKGDAVSKLDGWIAAGHVFTSAGSGGVVARYDADSNMTRLYADATAPTPNPAGFDGAPMVLDANTVRLLAMPGSDESGVVEYLFTETSGNTGGSSSGWQSSPYYEDTGLTADLEYRYTVTMRDAVGNVGSASAPASVTISTISAPAVSATQSGDWSDAATWGGSLPAAESDVTIPMGITVTLDGDQECGSVTVMGKLTADPDADCSLHCDWVMVMGMNAEFAVGSTTNRYPHQFTLTLKGLASEANPGGMGSKFLGAMNGGTIHLHGPERVSWTKLGATAVAGATTLTLDDPVDWVAGEQIVITSTDTNWNHAEERVIASVSGDGLTVTLTEALEYTHTGVTETHTRPTDNKTWSIELKAEVGLLSRDVKVQGDVFSEVDGFGGHTMAMDSATTAPAAFYAEGVEFYRMGQTGVTGRYPVHWHLLTDQAQGQYVRNCSIHHSFSRAVTIHGTDYITVEDNFCYDHIGHGIFLENGAERFNEIRNNVVLLTRRPEPGDELTPSDNSHDETQNRTPASFWITNPNNIFEDNIAAGTEGTGFWFIFPKTPLQPSASLPYYAGVRPSELPLGSFDRNTSHSCMNGLDINDKLSSAHSIIANGAWDNDGPFRFNDCAWFSNEIGIYAGIGARRDNVIYYNNTFADNSNVLMLATYHMIQESMLIADSGHRNLQGEGTTMYRVYDGAGQMLNNHMIGWDAENANLFKNPGASIKHPNHRFSGFTWDHAGSPRNVQPVFDHPSPGQWGQVILDQDGSVGGIAGSSIISNHGFMVIGNETQPAGWENNLVSPNRFAHLHATYPTANSNATPETAPNITVLRSKGGTKTEGLVYHSDFVNVTKRRHQLPLIVNDGFLYTIYYESLPAIRRIDFTFDDTEVGDAVLVRIKNFGKLTGLIVSLGSSHASLANLEASDRSGHYVEPNGDLYLRPVSTKRYLNEFNVLWSGEPSWTTTDSDFDGVSDVEEWNNGTDAFDFVESTSDNIEFTTENDFGGWSANADVSGLAVMDGRLTGAVSGNKPQLRKTDFAFEGNSALQIRLRYRNSSSGMVRLWWGTSINDAFSVDRKLAVTYSGAGDWQELVFNLGRESEWLDHEITRLRIDPNGSSGVFEVDYIRGCGPKKTDHAVWAAGWYGNELSDPWSVRGRNGLTNQQARLWGVDPYASNRDSPITQPLDVNTGKFAYTRRRAELSGAAYSIWVSTDLVNWTEDTNATQAVLSTDFQTDIETMQVNLSSAWLDHDELFIQVRAVE